MMPLRGDPRDGGHRISSAEIRSRVTALDMDNLTNHVKRAAGIQMAITNLRESAANAFINCHSGRNMITP